MQLNQQVANKEIFGIMNKISIFISEIYPFGFLRQRTKLAITDKFGTKGLVKKWYGWRIQEYGDNIL